MSKLLYTDLMEYANDAAAQAAYVTDGDPIYGSDFLTGGTASAIGTNVGAAANAVDNNESTYWGHNPERSPRPEWWQYDLGVSVTKIARKMTLHPYYLSGNCRIQNFNLRGSNDNSSFTTVYSGTHANTNAIETYTFSNSTAYRYYRVEITSRWGGGTRVGICEVEMIEITGYNIQSYSESTIKQQGTYSLKGVAVITDSLNDTLTKTLTDYLDYSIMDKLIFQVRSSRTGENLQLQIHDTGGTTSSHTIDIAVADTWQTETWDISGITGTDRDTIDKIIIKVSEASAANTFYFDNLYSEIKMEHSYPWIGG